jgi:hypothetical protein
MVLLLEGSQTRMQGVKCDERKVAKANNRLGIGNGTATAQNSESPSNLCIRTNAH